MFRLSVFSLAVIILMLGTAIAKQPPTHIGKPPGIKKVADPNSPNNTRDIISPGERESMGVKPRTWTGVVDPEVYARLEELTKSAATAKERVGREEGPEPFHLFHRIRFEDTVYVQVQTKDNAKQRVLASLRASEFQSPHLFAKASAFVGYATKHALDKLANNPDVLGVCLDDKPLVERPPVFFKDMLPKNSSPVASSQPGVTEGRVDPDVYRAFELHDRVYVIVHFDKKTQPGLSGRSMQENRKQWIALTTVQKQLRNRVLSQVSADDFWFYANLGRGISGYVTKDGIRDLLKDKDVARVYLSEMLTTQVIGR